MIEKLYSRLDFQLATLSGMLLLSGVLSYFFDFVPLLRLSLWTFFLGLLGGVLLIAIRIGTEYFLNRNTPRWSFRLLLSEKELNSVSIGKVIIQAAGEETLLRGFIFVPLIISMVFPGAMLLAFATNAFLSIVLYSVREKIDYIAGIQATLLAIIYLYSYSVFAVITARFLGELTLLFASHYKLTQIIQKRFSHVITRAV